MKKSLFALAAMGAFAGAAQAQSSVTVYGILDYGYQSASQTQAGTSTNTVTKTQTSGLFGSGESTSRLGFRGTEDLGGGTRAFFTAEVALNTDPTGVTTGAGSGLFSNSATGNRQTFIGLAQKGIGQASIGVQYTPLHEEVTSTVAGNANNQVGDVLYDRRGVGVDYTASGNATNTSYTVRSSNALILKTDRFSGFQLKGMFVTNGRTSNQTSTAGTGENANIGYGLNANYQWQKLYVTASWQNLRNNNPNGVAAVSATATSPALSAVAANTFAPGYNGGAVTPGINSTDTQQYYAATYDFGILKAFVGYVNRKAMSEINSANYVSRTAQQIGVRAPVTKSVQAWASVGSGRINNGGSASPTANFYGWQVGSDYFLSKRTNLYAIYGGMNTSNSTTGAYASSTTSGVPTSWNQSSFAIGARHTF